VVWLLCICIVLVVVVFALSIKIIVMRRAATEICIELTEKLNSDTNTLISISTEDKVMSCLADGINTQLKELHRQRRRFTQGDLELKTAITNISHDLRTPITAISSYLDLLDKAEKNETVERYLDIIRNRTEALSLLTEEMFRYSLITSPEHELKVEPVSVNKVLENSILEYYAALHERGITPDIYITEKQVVRSLNQVALSRIFSNLLSNAIKYSNGDLRIELTDNGVITFSNTALDLCELQVERLFDRFYTLESARKSTGLGLSIARILIEQMNGTITAKYENETLSICIMLPRE
jgi:hypothetical protein